MNSILDKFGMTTSITCAVHCAVMPLIVTFLPYFGLGVLATEGFEWLVFILSAVLAIGSICLGYRQHKDKRVYSIMSIGLALLALGRYAHENNWGLKGVLLLVCGGLVIAASHWLNNKLCQTCKVCHH